MMPLKTSKYKSYALFLILLFPGFLGMVGSLSAQPRPSTRLDSLAAARAAGWTAFGQVQQGRLAESIRHYGRAVDLAPDPFLQAHFRLDLALAFQRMHHLPAALQHVRLAKVMLRSLAPRTDSTRFLLPRAAYIEVDLRLQALSADPLAPDSLRRLAQQAEAAAAALDEARVAPRRAQALATAAEAWCLVKQPVRALARMQQAVALARTVHLADLEAAMLWKLARLQTALGMPELAEQTLADALATPHMPDLRRRILHLQAYLRGQLGDKAGAEALYRQGVALTEQSLAGLEDDVLASTAFTYWDEAHRGLVRLLLEQGRPEEAFLQLEQARARFFRPHSTATPLLRVLQDTLRVQRRVLLSYFVDEVDSFLPHLPRSWVLVVSAEQVRAIPLEGMSQETLQAQMYQVSPLLLAEEPLTLNALQLRTSGLQGLYETLVHPLEPLLPPSAGWVIIPDGLLFRLPFAALMPNADTYLVERVPISYLLAARLLLVPTPVLETGLEVVALGKSDFEDVVSPPFLPGGFPPLPHIRKELFDLYAGVGCRQVLFGDATAAPVGNFGQWYQRVFGCPSLPMTRATEAIRAQPITTRILHLATHAYGTAQGQAFLVFSPDAASPASDGLIDQEELRSVPWQAQLVVLSACRTGIGVYRGGDGMMGLQAAFHRLGVPATLSTLWAVDDRAMFALISRFYAGLQAGHSKDVALQQAQVEYLRTASPERRNPYFWAVPVLYGTHTPLLLESRFLLLTRRQWFIALGGGVLLLLCYCYFWYQRHART
jgi:CHAT domain-containing protein